jgi:glutamate synthase (NADPH/NADH) small chain
VTVLYRRTEAEMPAYPHEIQEARDEGVRFRFLSTPVAFLGWWYLEGVHCRAMALGEPDESGRRRPVPVEGSDFTLLADTAVKAIGQQSRDELSGWIDGLDLVRGRVAVDEDGRTGNRRFFAGGDAINGGASVVEAVRDGKRAAEAIDKELRCRS